MSTSATPRGLLFGTAAESYERFRLGYPDEVVDRTLDYAGRRGRLRRRGRRRHRQGHPGLRQPGIHVLALEPDPEMYGVLERETAGMPVTPLRSRPSRRTTAPDRPALRGRGLALDRPGRAGATLPTCSPTAASLAVFGGPIRLADPSVQAVVAAAVGGDVDDPAFRPHDPDRGTRRAGRRGDPRVGPVHRRGAPPDPLGRSCSRSASTSATSRRSRPSCELAIGGAPGRAAAHRRGAPVAGPARPVGRPPPRHVARYRLSRRGRRSPGRGRWRRCRPARRGRSRAPVTRVARAGEPSTKSMRIPRLRSKRCR